MDFGKVLGRAWEITWRWKILWILGFLAALGQGNSGGQFNYTFDERDFERFSYQFGDSREQIFALLGGIVLGLICLFLIIAIALWVISVIARGGLIAGVQQVEEEGSTSFGKAWSVGVRKFWTLFGLAVLAALPMIILVIVGVTLLIFGIFAGVGLMDVTEEGGITAIILVSVLCGGFLCCGLVILVVVPVTTCGRGRGEIGIDILTSSCFSSTPKFSTCSWRLRSR